MLLKYFLGLASSEEAIALENWRKECRENDEYFQEIWKTWSIENDYQLPPLTDSWLKVKARVEQSSPVSNLKINRLNFKSWLTYAAMLLILLSAGYWWTTSTSKEKQKEFVFEIRGKVYEFAPNASFVLDSNSVLRQSLSKNEENYFQLRGGASFEFKNSQPDFRLRLATGLNLRDIGTRFSVKGNNLESKIIVFSGAVEVWNELERKIILKNQTLAYSAANKQFIIGDRRANFNFEDEKLEAVSEKISSYFDVKINYSNLNLQEKMITLKADGISLEETLQIVAATLAINYKIDESKNNITLYP